MHYNTKRYLAVAIDPIHIGAGGHRLGRVDMTVVRDPITNVPKIPGTSLSGALKFFADTALYQAGTKSNRCASTKGSDKENKHEKDACPICCAFGYTPQNDSGGASAQGIVQFSDATLLAYPVNTLLGPVWVTTKPRLQDCLGLGDGEDGLGEHYSLPRGNDLTSPLNNRLNFGWILLEEGGAGSIPSVEEIVAAGVEPRYAKRFVVVSEFVFAHLVNDNMEVRTSVVIDPETGSAKEGGLFTFEAVARGAIFQFDLAENDYYTRWNQVVWEGKPATPLAMIERYALPGVKAIGMGGMTTRGFGRLAIAPASAAKPV